jgi:hypothetical protein
MEDLMLYFFREKPGVMSTYYRFRHLVINAILFGVIVTALLTKNDILRSLSLGMGLGIVLVNIGDNINRLRSSEH